MDILPRPQHTLLKAHKALPRRSVPVGTIPLPPTTQSHLQRHNSEQKVLGKAAEIVSWIPEPDVIHLALDHSLPLTPPSNSPEDEGTSWIEGPLPDDHKVTTRSVSSGITTPILQRSPPTPETTPPRVNHLQHTPVLGPNAPSKSVGTRTGSFETARENMSSEDESDQPPSPSMQPSRQKWLKQAAPAKLKEIGLGLELELETEHASPSETTPKPSRRKHDFVTFDGVWGTRKDVLLDSGSTESLVWEVEKRSLKRPKISTQVPGNPPVANGDVLLSKSLSLRQRLEQSRNSPTSASTERFAKHINWPLHDNGHLDLDVRFRDFDNRRFSQMSATSTIEAKVIDSSTPKRRQTLRHTGKFSRLDAASAQSNRSSMLSTHESTRPRRLRHTQSPEAIKRGSVSSDVVLKSGPDRSKKRQDSIPVIVIPERRSSLGSSAPGSRRLSKTLSLTSRQQSSRPTTAPEEATGYFDTPRQERRTVSAKLPPSTILTTKERSIREVPPALIAETPAVSANISKKVSRATSTVSTNAASVNGLQEHPINTQPVTHTEEPQASQNHKAQSESFDRSIVGDWAAVRPNSTQITPFSLRSAHSSTPGTLEVNEATAISIYPHTNKSILVVQQLPRRDSEPVEHSAIVASNASFALPGPHAPALIHHAKTRDLLQSPLKNPRDAPQPPDFKVIPPTPVPNSDPTQDQDRDRDRDTASASGNRFSRSFIIVKRALSARRYSEAIVSPLTRGLSRRNSTAVRRTSYASDKDTKLHPFWRPRGFWDDCSESDSDSEFGNDGPLVGNSLGMPSSQTVTEISAAQPPRRANSFSQRFSESLRFSRGNFGRRRHSVAGSHHDENSGTTGCAANRHHYVYEKGNEEARHSYEFIQPEQHSELMGKDEDTAMPRLGYPVQFVGLKELVAKRKEKRQEGKRERLREKLRGGGAVVPVQDGAPQGWGGGGYLRNI